MLDYELSNATFEHLTMLSPKIIKYYYFIEILNILQYSH